MTIMTISVLGCDIANAGGVNQHSTILAIDIDSFSTFISISFVS